MAFGTLFRLRPGHWPFWICCLALLGLSPRLGATNTFVVVVSDFENNTGESKRDNLGRGLAQMLRTDLSILETVVVVEREELQAIRREYELAESGMMDLSTVAEMGRGLGARYAIMGSLTAMEPTLRLDARVVEIASLEIVGAVEVTGSLEDFFFMEKELAAELLKTMSIEPSARENARLGRLHTESFEAFEAWSEAIAALDRGEVQDAQRSLERALLADDDFALAAQILEGLRTRLD